MRGIQQVLRGDFATKGSDIASAATADLGAIQGSWHDVTGVVTITSLGTVAAGIGKWVRFTGALTLTHNATSLILPGGANITTANGDMAKFLSLGSGNWVCATYFKAGSLYATLAGTETLTNKTVNLTSNTLVATSAQLAAAVTDETGSGALVFGTSPTISSPSLTTPALGTPSSGVLTNCTGLPTAGLVDGAVTEAKLGASAVAQAKLKTTSGEVSTNSATGVNLTLPGGAFGFYPRLKSSGGSAETITARISDAFSTQAAVTNIFLIDGGITSDLSAAQQTYIQASPPYNLGNGDVPLFMFALVDALGQIKATYVAPEPPWAYNGPTDIRADYYRDGKGFQRPRLTAQQRLDLRDPAKRDSVFAALATAPDVEITHAIKNADMGLIPHPFLSNNLTGLTVVLLDAISPFGDQMATLHGVGESIGGLLNDGHLAIDNTPLSAITPQGVIACKASWK